MDVLQVRLRTLARVLFWPVFLLALSALALEVGAWQQEFNIKGPFAAVSNPPQRALIVPVPQEGRAPWWRQPLLGATTEKPFESFLELRINGRVIRPPYQQYLDIETGRTSGFNHWGTNVFFSLPEGISNGPETTVTLRYKIKPRIWVSLVLAFLSLALLRLAYRQTVRRFTASYGDTVVTVLLRLPYGIQFGLFGVALAACLAYAAASCYALATGWALPTTAPLRWSPLAEWGARSEPYLGYLLLMLAGYGALTTWLAGSNADHRKLVERYEVLSLWLIRWLGAPIVATILVLRVSAMWNGMEGPGNPNSANIGGLIPFSDAANYLTAAFDQVKDGYWNEQALRRPLAQAFRSVLLILSNYSLPLQLALQGVLVAAAACIATYAVAIWRGTWAGLAFFALTYIYFRYFVPTTLTEPFGLFWAFLSIPFFIEAFRTGSVQPALVAFAMTMMAMMTRMGSMFTIPALLLWLLWSFGKGLGAKLKIAAASFAILAAVLGLNSLLQSTYGRAAGSTSGNFAYVLCGLSMGSTWNACIEKLIAEHKPVPTSEEDRVKVQYSMAMENLQANPGVFFSRLAANEREFRRHFPEVMWKGYSLAIDLPDWLWPNALFWMSVIGLAFLALRRATGRELSFWLFAWVSISASASFIYPDDGSRALAASQPLIALFFAMGLTSPILAPISTPSRWRCLRFGWAGLIAAALLFVCLPWLAYHFASANAVLANPPELKKNEVLVFGGRQMSGFLVVEDGMPLRQDIPTLHLKDFDAIIKDSLVELYYQDLLHPKMPPLPFGFVFAPRAQKGAGSNHQYIVPAHVMEHPEVPVWRFELERWGYRPGGFGEYWFLVTKATPVP